MISFILVQHNQTELTRQAIASLRHHEPDPYEIIVIDNGSSEPVDASLETECRIIVTRENKGFGSGNNQGASAAKGEYLFFLNNDSIVNGSLVRPVVAYFEQHSDVGAVAVRLQNSDGTPQISTGRFPTILTEFGMKRGVPSYPAVHSGSVEWATGAALAIRRKVYERVGGFDEEYFLYFEDVDLCRRIHNAGFDIHLIESTPVTHLGGGSRPNEKEPWVQVEYRKSQLRYYDRHNSLLQNIALRAYLLVKFGGAFLFKGRRNREVSLKVLSLIVRRTDAHRTRRP